MKTYRRARRLAPAARRGRRACVLPSRPAAPIVTTAASDARDRQLVHDQDVGPAAGVRPDRVDRRPRRSTTRSSPTRAAISPHPIPLLVSSWKAIEEREDVHVPAQAERALRERDAAHVGRRRLLAAAAGQPEGQPGLPARRRHGQRRRASTRSCMHSTTPARALPAILANPSTGIVNSKLVKAHGGTDAARTRPRPTRPSSGSTRRRSRGAGSGPYVLSSLQHDLADHAVAEHELLGREEAGVLRASSSATWSRRRS